MFPFPSVATRILPLGSRRFDDKISKVLSELALEEGVPVDRFERRPIER